MYDLIQSCEVYQKRLYAVLSPGVVSFLDVPMDPGQNYYSIDCKFLRRDRWLH
jgi:hypothetical protein